MSGKKDKRLAKLERKRRPAAKIVMVWYDRAAGWTEEEAIARAFPEGEPPGVQIMLLSWMTAADAKAAEQEPTSLGQADP
jgi:hypothetical protein